MESILGAPGPVFLLPTGSSEIYSVHQWGAGPTAVVLKQTGPWTVGALANHRSFASAGNPSPDVNATFIQPFVSYTTPDAWTFTLNTESTYDWNAKKWQVPINGIVSKVVKIGPQLVSFSVWSALLRGQIPMRPPRAGASLRGDLTVPQVRVRTDARGRRQWPIPDVE